VRLYDEVSGRLVPVEIGPRMRVYVCGITPYDSAHLGHAFTYVHLDVLVRYLRYLGAEVLHVQNVTDVDDDILRVARERGVDYRELARQENARFEGAMRALGVAEPTQVPWASQFIAEIEEEARALLEAGRAYLRDGTVYFRVASDPGYGRLSHLSREEMLELAAERGGHPEDPAKDGPLDFVLWQRSAPGEPWWDSPWGPGRPGWHIECSTMARRLLGQPVDVHAGGSDLIFPHHESELAQAESLPGERPFVRHWVHTGTVYQGGEKMSKSLGNLTFVDDLLARHTAEAIRRLLLGRHYREDWEFRPADLERSATAVSAVGADTPKGGELKERFFEALDRDLDTPEALRCLDLARGSDDREATELVEAGSAILGLPPPP
jgi:L-cysteine:1D-myo-inositol 2-amino-2-deoxy-alpha-D-glucopyranoside ligase